MRGLNIVGFVAVVLLEIIHQKTTVCAAMGNAESFGELGDGLQKGVRQLFSRGYKLLDKPPDMGFLKRLSNIFAPGKIGSDTGPGFYGPAQLPGQGYMGPGGFNQPSKLPFQKPLVNGPGAVNEYGGLGQNSGGVSSMYNQGVGRVGPEVNNQMSNTAGLGPAGVLQQPLNRVF